VVQELLRRFEDFVQAVTQDIMAEVQCQPKVRESKFSACLCANVRSQFWTLVGNLCEKAPKAAESLGTRIFKYVRRGDRPRDVIEEPVAQSSAPDRCIAQSRKDKDEDRSYRPPKYAKATDTRSMLETGEKRRSTRLAGGKLAKASNKLHSKSTKEAECDSKVADSATQGDTKGVECDDSNVTNWASLSDHVDDSPLDHAKVTSSTRTQGQSPESPKLGDLIQSTPAHQTKAGPIESPQTEEIYRKKIPTSLESIRSSPGLASTVRGDARALTDSILESVRIIHGLSKHQDGPPRQVHATILRALRDPCQGIFTSSNWSNGSM